jgi:hypothetical protein
MAVPRTEEERRTYVLRALQLNPIHQAEAILSLRREYFAYAAAVTTPADSVSIREVRMQIVEEIETLREEFWTLSQKDVEGAAARIATERFPDLHPAAERLRVAARLRPALLKLEQHPLFQTEFYADLQTVLIGSPAAAREARTRVDQRWRGTYHRTAVRRMVRYLKHKTPEIIDLEPEWFATLMGQRTPQQIAGSLWKDLAPVRQIVLRIATYVVVSFLLLALVSWVTR